MPPEGRSQRDIFPIIIETESVTESPRRYILNETVGGFIYVPSMSHLHPRRHSQTDKGQRVLLASQKDHIGSWFSSREEPAISL